VKKFELQERFKLPEGIETRLKNLQVGEKLYFVLERDASIYTEIQPEALKEYPNTVYPSLELTKTSSGVETKYTGVKHV
jgi:hypothetical protein